MIPIQVSFTATEAPRKRGSLRDVVATITLQSPQAATLTAVRLSIEDCVDRELAASRLLPVGVPVVLTAAFPLLADKPRASGSFIERNALRKNIAWIEEVFAEIEKPARTAKVSFWLHVGDEAPLLQEHHFVTSL